MPLVPTLAVVLGLVSGTIAGRRLATRGITAQNALTGRQRTAYAILLTVAALFALVYFQPKLSVLGWIPTPVILYAEEGVWPLVIAMAAFALGLLAVLEWPGRREPRRATTAVIGALVLATGLGYLFWRTLPITGLLSGSNVHDGVVFQTTAYTCAPATIATLARATGMDTALTERAVVLVAGTTREGTSTLRELSAMRALGMAPRFARRLTADSLVAIARPALLHVDEPVGSVTIRHAVALLAVDAARRTVTIGNPLHGRQVMRFDQLPGYWMGEAVFVTRAPPLGSP